MDLIRLSRTHQSRPQSLQTTHLLTSLQQKTELRRRLVEKSSADWRRQRPRKKDSA